MRSNYASSDCAASIVYSHNAQNPGSILESSRDSYLLYECSAPDKTVHIQLCQDILVDSILIGNFELFSSAFRQIKVYATDRYVYADTNWNFLGVFNGQDLREEQLFTIQNPHIWASHLKIEFISYWGNEFYCPINTLAVYGTTMLDQSKNMLTPDEEQVECDVPNIADPDPCAVETSPLEQKQCCKPRLETGGGSIYEKILGRIQALEVQNRKTETYIKTMNTTHIQETYKLEQALLATSEKLQYHQRTIALEALLLLIIIGYGLLRTLARYRLTNDHEGDYVTSLSLSKGFPFGLDEQRPSSPIKYSLSSPPAIPSPPAEESELDAIEQIVNMQQSAQAVAHIFQ